MRDWIKAFENFMGIERDSVSAAEKVVATIGATLSIILTAFISYQFTGVSGATLIVPSMGSSAVLLFAVPHGKLSQPWPLIGGHLVSAAVGVACQQYIPHPFLAAGVAVGLAVGMMHLLKCMHPPGGATAMTAAIAGGSIQHLGYEFIVTPILLNALILFLIAMLFNGLFAWRRYPVGAMMRFRDNPHQQKVDQSKYILDKIYIERALQKLDLLVDLTTDDLQRLIQLTLVEAESQHLSPQQILLGHYYSNGKTGPEWSVRHVIDESSSNSPEKDMVIYRVAEGYGMGNAYSSTRQEFADWASREVFSNKAKK